MIPGRTASRAQALAIAAAIGATELIARRIAPSRARAWLSAYAAIGAVGALIPPADGSRRARPSDATLAVAVLAAVSYPILRELAGDGRRPPPDPLPLELAALATVAVAEELSWARHVEPALGDVETAFVFAAKHAAIDGNIGRIPALAMFWWGLAGIRARSTPAAAATHVLLNCGGVVLGHLLRRDQF